ncbi:hypothetical protein VNO77_37416 [Canavalia gladiata]|uniref:Uncharacterized protein n=1 Tax=Canavalia gladiata TaxID=3824 RepID=A0AAN9PUS1_CANGL
MVTSFHKLTKQQHHVNELSLSSITSTLSPSPIDIQGFFSSTPKFEPFIQALTITLIDLSKDGRKLDQLKDNFERQSVDLLFFSTLMLLFDFVKSDDIKILRDIEQFCTT